MSISLILFGLDGRRKKWAPLGGPTFFRRVGFFGTWVTTKGSDGTFPRPCGGKSPDSFSPRLIPFFVPMEPWQSLAKENCSSLYREWPPVFEDANPGPRKKFHPNNHIIIYVPFSLSAVFYLP